MQGFESEGALGFQGVLWWALGPRMNLQGAGDRRCSPGKSKGFLDGWHVDEGLLDFGCIGLDLKG